MNIDNLFEQLHTVFGEARTYENPDGDGEILVIPPGHETVTLSGPQRRRRNHEFHDIESLCAWVRHQRVLAAPTQVETLVSTKLVDVHFDAGKIEADSALCALVAHPLWALWGDVLGRPMTQKTFHRLLIVGRGAASTHPSTDGSGGINAADYIAQQVGVLKVVSTGELKSELGPGGMTIFQGKSEKQEVSGRIPPTIKLWTPFFRGVKVPYSETPPLNDEGPSISIAEHEPRYEIELFLEFDIIDNEPTFTLTAPGLPLVADEALGGVVTWVKHCLGPDYLVGRGRLHTTVVPDRTPRT